MPLFPSRHSGTIVVLLAAFIFGPARAEVDAVPQEQSSYLTSFAQCRQIDDAGVRARCYDKVYDALAGASARRDVAIISRDDVERRRRRSFGLVSPNAALSQPAIPSPPDEKRINSTIKAVLPAGDGRYRIMLDTGAVWLTTDAPSSVPKPGGLILIRQGSLNSYFLKLGRGRAIRAIRVR